MPRGVNIFRIINDIIKPIRTNLKFEPSIVKQDSDNRFVTDIEKDQWNSGSILPSRIIQDSDNRFVTDIEKDQWNSATGSVFANSFILPTIQSIQLNNTSQILQASDLGITLFEDCQVIQAHDNNYYMFLDDFSGYANNDVYCVRASDPKFSQNLSIIGKVIDRPNSRVGGVVYDRINEEYVMYITDRGTPRQGILAYSINKNNFPAGVWTNNGVVLATSSVYSSEILDSMGNALINNAGLYTLYFSRIADNIGWLGYAFSKSPKSVFSEFEGNPIFTAVPSDFPYDNSLSLGNIHFRYLQPLANGYLGFYETQNSSGTRWAIGAMFIGENFMYGQDVQGSPFFQEDTRSYANCNSGIVDMNAKKLYVYYNSSELDTGDDFKYQHVAEFDIL